MYCSATLLGVSVLTITFVAASKLPDFVKKCKRDDVNFSECWKNTLEDLRPHLERGIWEFNVPSIDPLSISKFVISQNDPRVGKYDLTMTQVNYTGGKAYQILGNELDLTNWKFKLQLKFPKLDVTSILKLNGTVFGFDINGVTKGNGEFHNVIANLSANGKLSTKGGKTYVNWNNDNSTLSYEKMKLDIPGFFDNKQLDIAFNEAINGNGDLLYSHLSIIIESTFEAYLLEALNRVHKAFPVETLYA